MVMTLSRGCGLPPNPRCGLPRSRASLITPLGGNTTDWRAGCGRSARPVRREGECFLALSLAATQGVQAQQKRPRPLGMAQDRSHDPRPPTDTAGRVNPGEPRTAAQDAGDPPQQFVPGNRRIVIREAVAASDPVGLALFADF